MWELLHFSQYTLYCLNFGQEEYIYTAKKKKSSLKNTRETRFRSWKPPPFKIARKLHLSWQIDCMKDINQKARKETLRKQEKIKRAISS